MILWVGLGNPGPKYELTRHNIGARMLTGVFPEASFKLDRSLNSFLAQVENDEGIHTILLPQTYMNLSGDAVSRAMRRFQVAAERMVVMHDEIELPPGKVMHKFGGGHKGHNGLRDIIQKISTPDFHRIRIGVGRPVHGEVADYVLSRMPENEIPDITLIQKIISENILPGMIREKTGGK